MDDTSEKCIPFASKPPVSPKSYLPMAGASYEGWQPPYLMANHGEVGGVWTTPFPKPLDGMDCPYPSMDVSSNNFHILPPLARNPIRSITPSSTNKNGITVKTELGIDYEMRWGPNKDPNMDKTRLRRILSNRISARKSRLKKIQYLHEMEKRGQDLQAEVAVLNPLLVSEKELQKRLQMENLILKEKTSRIEESKATVKWLKELLEAQQNMRMQEPSTHGCNYEQMAADSSSLEAEPKPMEARGSLTHPLTLAHWPLILQIA
ncbi:hypothetical protein Acr_28g0003620 [Actinidia rufa]|uniref:BZIP domain-containing protein n=1 Tax=Actinidia rufa TaxID=165716 RepID=A0A7J0H982_9ERIC|nr:hypothetical protein Acr_28g0003620 [Actinidia rufa]